jgi:hypothetical protein
LPQEYFLQYGAKENRNDTRRHKMTFKKKVIILCGLSAVLLVSYILTFVLSSTERAARGAQWAPLTKEDVANADSIEIKTDWQEEPQGDALVEGNNLPEGNLLFVKVENNWFIQLEGKNYPARSSRIDDMFDALTKKAPYIVHSNSESSYAKFQVADDAKKVITIKRGDLSLLKLYIGSGEASWNSIYVRKGGESAVRSGKDIFSAYTTGGSNAWCDTRLFPEHDALGLSVDAVQRIRVVPPASSIAATTAEGESPIKASSPYGIVRDGKAWKFDGAVSGEELNGSAVDEAVRFMLDSSGESFVTDVSTNDASFAESNADAGRVFLEIGDGKTYSVTLGQKVNGKYTALSTLTAAGGYVVSLSDWTVSRLWRDKNDYVASEK